MHNPVVAGEVELVPARPPRRRSLLARIDLTTRSTMAVGVVLALVGATAVMRAGFEPPLTRQIVFSGGFLHTALLGVVEVVAGLLLVVAARARARTAVMMIAGALATVAMASTRIGTLQRWLAMEERYAWLLVTGALVLESVNLLASD